MTDLTAKQRQQRCDWVREMWVSGAGTPNWRACLHCVNALLHRGFKDYELIDAFKRPEANPAAVDALFEEYMRHKLIGETP